MLTNLLRNKLCRFTVNIILTAAVAVLPVTNGHSQVPIAGIVHTTAKVSPVLLNGLKVNINDPFQFSFILTRGDQPLSDETRQREYLKMVRYFMAALTTPSQDTWVNLSPAEAQRIIPDSLALTEMGRDLLEQDYQLKYLTASLMNPADQLGRHFWARIYHQAFERYGTTNIPVDTFNKVWIMADRADIYEKDNTALVVRSHLKVMLEQDLIAAGSDIINITGTAPLSPGPGDPNSRKMASDALREIILPVIEHEVNEGTTFVRLRQIYAAMILATWFKKTLQDSLLGQVYSDKSKVRGIDLNDRSDRDRIFSQYLETYRKGVFNFIKEEIDESSQELLPRKYFSGGMVPPDAAMIRSLPIAETIKSLGPPTGIAPMDVAQISLIDTVSGKTIANPREPVAIKADQNKRDPGNLKTTDKSPRFLALQFLYQGLLSTVSRRDNRRWSLNSINGRKIGLLAMLTLSTLTAPAFALPMETLLPAPTTISASLESTTIQQDTSPDSFLLDLLNVNTNDLAVNLAASPELVAEEQSPQTGQITAAAPQPLSGTYIERFTGIRSPGSLDDHNVTTRQNQRIPDFEVVSPEDDIAGNTIKVGQKYMLIKPGMLVSLQKVNQLGHKLPAGVRPSKDQKVVVGIFLIESVPVSAAAAAPPDPPKNIAPLQNQDQNTPAAVQDPPADAKPAAVQPDMVQPEAVQPTTVQPTAAQPVAADDPITLARTLLDAKLKFKTAKPYAKIDQNTISPEIRDGLIRARWAEPAKDGKHLNILLSHQQIKLAAAGGGHPPPKKVIDNNYTQVVSAVWNRHPELKKIGVSQVSFQAVVQAMAQIESAYNANALSSAEAKGLMQVMDATGARFARKLNKVWQPWDPVLNVEVGAEYLAVLIKLANVRVPHYAAGLQQIIDTHFPGMEFSSTDKAIMLAAGFYNAGENGLERFKNGNRQLGVPETYNHMILHARNYRHLRGSKVLNGWSRVHYKQASTTSVVKNSTTPPKPDRDLPKNTLTKNTAKAQPRAESKEELDSLNPREVRARLQEAFDHPLFDPFAQKQSKDGSQAAGENNVGGIRLTDRDLILTIRTDDHGRPLPLKFQTPEIINIDGLAPILTSITPAAIAAIPLLQELLKNSE